MSSSVTRAVASLLLAQGVIGVAHAQTAQLEEIVVTAQKRSQNLQDTPIAISAVTGESIEKLNIDDIGAIAAVNPSLVYSEAGGEAQLYIRGIGSNIFSVGVDQSVATHIDGVYTGRANMGLTQFLDIDQVEILRGPQGTLYGRNATGGAINIVSRAPIDDFEGYVSGLVGSFNRVDVRGALSGPLSEHLSARVAVRRLKDDGYTDDLDPRGANKIDDNDLTAVRGSLRWRNDTVTATLIAEHSEFENGNTSIFLIDNTGLAESFGAKTPSGWVDSSAPTRAHSITTTPICRSRFLRAQGISRPPSRPMRPKRPSKVWSWICSQSPPSRSTSRPLWPFSMRPTIALSPRMAVATQPM